MKNERRQKQVKNSLATFIENSITQIKPQATNILHGVVIALICVLLFTIWRQFSSKNTLDFYNDVRHLSSFNLLTVDTEQFDSTITEYTTKYPSGANHAHVSLLIGNLYFLKSGEPLGSGKRDEAIATFEKALEFYTTADKFNLKQQDLAENAAWGVAQTNEALASLKEGDYLATAIAQYERLCKTWPNGVYTELAAEQLQLLKRPDTGTFLVAYRNSNPTLFAPDLQTPDITAPDGGIDSTITPGGFDPGLILETPSGDGTEVEVEPGLTTEPVPAPETAEAPQIVEEKQDTEQQPAE